MDQPDNQKGFKRQLHNSWEAAAPIDLEQDEDHTCVYV